MVFANNFDNKAYKKVIIYFFSGTGNSRNVADWLAQVAKKTTSKAK